MVKSKKLTKNRSLTIPKDIAAAAGIIGGTAVDLTSSAGGIIITKHVPACVYCGSAESVKVLRGTEICAKCAEEIRKEL
ncbi:MAG: AbrB/MazE/SpoVT family DNA-binding domain-containing protein, partial [Ruminococcus sp.]|nr:AbrB/MazE/SpoVT family DNA-binding domain-containing protein [Ruminococcus sp.]